MTDAFTSPSGFPGHVGPNREQINYFDADVATQYDADAMAIFAPEVIEPTVDILSELAGNGAALEFAVGTGRVALPLSARGIAVTGI